MGLVDGDMTVQYGDRVVELDQPELFFSKPQDTACRITQVKKTTGYLKSPRIFKTLHNREITAIDYVSCTGDQKELLQRFIKDAAKYATKPIINL